MAPDCFAINSVNKFRERLPYKKNNFRINSYKIDNTK